jgi:limonene-1,2-epoxide hydrolase
MAVETAVLALWKALSARHWEGVKAAVTEDCIYVDMPQGPTLAARGPDDIVKRLKVGLEKLASYENHEGLLVSDGVNVLYEHSETWVWATGETATLDFVSVHRVENGKVALWKDYWDFNGLAANAPSTWMEDLMAGDMSWIYDATGKI